MDESGLAGLLPLFPILTRPTTASYYSIPCRGKTDAGKEPASPTSLAELPFTNVLCHAALSAGDT